MTREYLSADVRRERILQAAAEQFAARGFHATSVEDLCRVTGLSPGGLYRHFPSKRHVVVALVAADMTESVARLTAAIEAARDPRAAVDAVVDITLQPLQDPPTAALRAEIMAEAARSPEIAAAAAEHDDRLGALVRAALVAAAEPGSPAAEDPDAATELLLVVLDGIAARCAVLGTMHEEWVPLARAAAASLVEGNAG